jgi:peptidyl-prolyl cis-trans isomerase SurA
MKKRLSFIVCTYVLFLVISGHSLAKEQVVDRIVAVVGDQIILLSEAQAQIEAQMMSRKLDYNSSPKLLAALQDEVIQAMVNDQLLLVKAEKDSIIPDPKDVDTSVKNMMLNIRKQFPDDDTFKKALEENGFTEVKIRYMFNKMAKKNVIQQMMIEKIKQSVSVPPQEMETWYASHKDSLDKVPEQFKLSHIMITPKISETKKKAAREKIEGILQRIKNGEDFSELAKKYSEDTATAAGGGDIGVYFKRTDFDERFTTPAFALKKGEVSEVVETGLGLHLIKVEDIKGNEIRARHIVLILKPDSDDEKAIVDGLKNIREDVLAGKITFEDAAKKNTEDETTRNFGGQMRWLYVGDPEIPASYIREAAKLKKGEISEPFRDESGNIHIIRLNDRKESHVLSLQTDRTTIEAMAKQDKVVKEFNRLFNQLRKETYIDIRLE